MKKITTPVSVRAAIAIALCLTFIIYPQLRVSSAKAAAADVKNESQLRSEASRYDAAIRAISGIANMKFDTPEDLKKALVILDRERPNLRFHRSKFVVIGLNDSAFVSAARKKFPNKQAAEAFAKQLAADTKLALTLEGAESLKTRIRQSITNDAATLRRAADRLKEAAAKFKRAQLRMTPGTGTTDEFKVLKAGFSDAPRSAALTETPAMPGLDPAIILTIILIIVVYAVVIYYGLKWFGPSIGIGTDEVKDEFAECQETADGRYSQCVSEANGLPSGLPFFVREVAQAACYANWLSRQAACLTLYL